MDIPKTVTPQPSTPLGKAFTNQTVPKKPEEMKDVFIPDSEIVAKSLREPDFINLKPKNKSLYLFWGNRAVGDKESKMRINNLQAKGFKIARADELTTADGEPVPEALEVDGRVMYGDLIAMLIPRVDYIGQTKHNALKAARYVQHPGMVTSKNGDGTTKSETVFPRTNSKIQPFVPSQEVAEALTGKNLDKVGDI